MKHSFLVFTLSFFSVHLAAQTQFSLEQVIAVALEKNYDVQLAINTKTSAEANTKLITGAYMPQINLVGSTVWNSNHIRVEFSDASRNNEGDAKSNSTNLGVQLSWLLYDGTRMFATKRRIHEMVTQGDFQVKEQMVNTMSEVIAAYYNIVRSKQQLNAILEQMGVNEERVKLAETKLQVGTGGKPELLQAKVDLNAQRAQIYTQKTLIEQQKQTLNNLTGMELGAPFDVIDTIIINLNIQKEELLENLESTSYSLQSLQKEVLIADLTRQEQRASRQPFVYFNSNYNFLKNENTVAINNFSPLFNQTSGLNYGFSVTYPLFNGFQIDRGVAQAKINLARQQVIYESQKANIISQVESAYISYQNSKEVLLIEEENIALAKENVYIALEGFKRGITTSIELRTAQQSLSDAYYRLINARYLSKVAETELLRLSGRLLL